MENEGRDLAAIVSADLMKMFEGMAKLCIQGAAEANDPTLNIIEKARKAHSRITLIIDDAMRGLGEVNQSMFVGGVMLGGER
jgi:hypothetical protein